MKQMLSIICIVAALGGQALAGEAGEGQVGDIMIQEAWARASLGSAPNSAAYMTLITEGGDTDRLVSASTPAAEKTELHTHMIEDGVAKMRQVDAIEVTPGEATVLEPGGLHVMLLGLTEKLEEGGAVPLTLTFENAGDVTLDLPVRGLRGGAHSDKKHTG